MSHNVPVQSLIDHIKTAIDVDPWAKEMVEELLKERKFLVDESGKITPLPVVFPNCPLKEYEAVVRCKDCKHRPTQTEPPKTYGFSIEFPEGSKCPCQCDDGFYSWYPNDDWFCADGERK